MNESKEGDKTAVDGAEGGSMEPPRIRTADRRQLSWRTEDLESVLAEDHRARGIWNFVGKLDLKQFYAPIKARGSGPGQPAIDPKILLVLWLYGISEGVGAARHLARLCEEHDAYRWICGGVSVNYHTLSDFRVDHGEALDALMTQILGVLMHQGLVHLKRVAQDGTRVRASAGAASFRRQKSLRKCLKAARAQVQAVKKQAEQPDSQQSSRERAARERAARQREQRLARALDEMKSVQAVKEDEDKPKARVSSTDPEARVMKMADGGYRPAYNVQLATDTESRVIVGVQVTNIGSDQGQMEPMLEEIERRAGSKPTEHLVDGGFTKLASITKASKAGVTVYAPVAKPRVEGIDPHLPKDGDTAEVAEWRRRMATDEAKEIYKERAATAETVNADLKATKGLDRLRVRGTSKVLCVALWAALTYNILRSISLGFA